MTRRRAVHREEEAEEDAGGDPGSGEGGGGQFQLQQPAGEGGRGPGGGAVPGVVRERRAEPVRDRGELGLRAQVLLLQAGPLQVAH